VSVDFEPGPVPVTDTGGLNHYLHHEYVEVDDADGAIPFARWFGSFHDGSPEADAAMKQRLAAGNVVADGANDRRRRSVRRARSPASVVVRSACRRRGEGVIDVVVGDTLVARRAPELGDHRGAAAVVREEQ
jgi:hypothetical protein